MPILLALALNQLRFHKLKRVVQTVLYAPHFISTMIICGMLRIFLSPSGGLINLLLGTSIDFLNQSSMFRSIYIISGIWQEAGWGTIIYLATLSSVDTSLYEAAQDLGCNPRQAFFKVVVPEILPGIISGFLMAFTYSLDDFIISYFVSGPTSQTLPITIYSMTRRKVSPEINALSAIIFVVVLAVLLVVNIHDAHKERENRMKARARA